MSRVNNYEWKQVTDFETLKDLRFDPMGPRHTPVPHYDAIGFFKRALAAHGIRVTSDRAYISPDTLRLVYTADVEPLDGRPGNEFGFSVGFINHNDRSRSFTGVAGTRSFVSNATMYATEGAIKTKHMQNVMHYLNDRTAQIIQWFRAYCQKQTGRVEAMKRTPADDKVLGRLVVEYVRRPYVLGAMNIKRIVGEYDKPKYEEYRPRTVWSLQNTTDRVFQRVKSPLAKLEAMEVFDEVVDEILLESAAADAGTAEIPSPPENQAVQKT